MGRANRPSNSTGSALREAPPSVTPEDTTESQMASDGFLIDRQTALPAARALREAGYQDVRLLTFATGKQAIVSLRPGSEDQIAVLPGEDFTEAERLENTDKAAAIKNKLWDAQDWIGEANPEDFFGQRDWSEEFWRFPCRLFHGTDAENIESIKTEGLLALDHSRGITNEYTGAAVFTHEDFDYALRYAGEEGAMVEIDTRAMKEDGFVPDVGPEDPVREAIMRGELADALGIDYYDGHEHLSADGVDSATTIIRSAIPPKYLLVRPVTEDDFDGDIL